MNTFGTIITGGVRINFYNNLRLSESRNKLPEEGLLEGFSQKQAETLFWIFFTKRQPKIVKTISAQKTSTFFIFMTLHHPFKYKSCATFLMVAAVYINCVCASPIAARLNIVKKVSE
jgi:hypothetical protein